MNPFDSTIVSFVNSFSRHSAFFDTLVSMLSENDLVKGGVIVALVWWVWFRPDPNRHENRNYLLSGILACLLSVVVARTLAHVLPFRERPLRNPNLHFVIPYGTDQSALINWSSFPSDHAAVFFALAMSIFFSWRALGVLALLHVCIFICFPRIYLGFHYPTDVLTGALIGIAMASLARLQGVRQGVADLAVPWLERSPGSFYACLFLLTFQIATIFESSREITHFFYRLVVPHN